MQHRPRFFRPAWNKVRLGLLILLALLSAPRADAGTQTNAASRPAVAEPRLEQKVKYATAQASVQDIARELAQQVGLKYDWQKSFDQTDPLCRRWVRNVAIDGKTCHQALEQILGPVGLRCQVENGAVVLYRSEATKPAPSRPLLEK